MSANPGLLLVMVTLIALSAAACGTEPRAPTPSPPARDSRTSSAVPRIVQFDFGSRARFGACIEPACPTPTRKTPAPAAPLEQRSTP